MSAASRHFLSCDWGTSSFRLRLVAREDLATLDTVRHGEGAKTLHTRLVEAGLADDPDARARAFEQVLAGAVEALAVRHAEEVRDAPVVISGMASSTVGWRELPYAPTPCPLDGSGLLTESLPALERGGSRHALLLVSGLSTGRDMLRGEEIEALGVLADPAFHSLHAGCRILLPGTHSKHLTLRDGALTDIRTYLTGELLELLSTRSLLSVSVAWPPPPFDPTHTPGPELDAFDAGVDAARDPGLAASLFQVRVRSVLDRASRDANTRFLTGLLLGAELRDLPADEPALPILLAASGPLLAPYRRALERLGFGARLRCAPDEVLTRAITAAHRLVLDRHAAGAGAGAGAA